MEVGSKLEVGNKLELILKLELIWKLELNWKLRLSWKLELSWKWKVKQKIVFAKFKFKLVQIIKCQLLKFNFNNTTISLFPLCG